MEISKKPWPILSVCGIQSRIDTNPDFQRPAVWSKAQKQLLIDTILRGYDVPKLYWRRTETKPDKYEVVDGQQRLRTVFEFQDGGFKLSKDADPIDGEAIAGLQYDELPDDLRLQFDNYSLDVIVLTETDDDEVREMFLRLQNGTTLKAQEKRNAMPGKMRDAVKSLVEHDFFTRVHFKNSRFTHDLVAAQMLAIELEGGPCHIRDSALNRMYEEQKDFDLGSTKGKKVKRVLNFLADTFPEKTPELERYSVISLYTIVSHCLEGYDMSGREEALRSWFIDFEIYRRAEMLKDEEVRDSEVIAYKERTSHSTDAQDSILWRHDFLLRKFFEAVPDIQIKDNQRLFTHTQRLAIYRRDQGRCQLKMKCQGEKCDWEKWQADHKIAWSKGGKTTVENGLVACTACNTSKGNS